MRIAEIYRSRQGEGRLTGEESVFVRTSGCNLRCWFCDTPYASWEPEGEDWSVEAILAEGERLAMSASGPARHTVITGGEPMLFAELIPLCAGLKAAGQHVTIETAGTLYLPVQCDLMSISPKLAGSAPAEETAGKWSQRHERARHAPEVIRRLISEYDYQLKFVIDSSVDCGEVLRYLADVSDVPPQRVYLMPQGTSQLELARKEEWLAPFARSHGFRFCPRKQIEWYGAVRGT